MRLTLHTIKLTKWLKDPAKNSSIQPWNPQCLQITITPMQYTANFKGSKNEKRDNKQCLLDTPRRVHSIIKDSKVREKICIYTKAIWHY